MNICLFIGDEWLLELVTHIIASCEDSR